MNGELLPVERAEGLETRIRPNPANGGVVRNLLIDSTGGWSSRLGYEPYNVAISSSWSWSPFSNVGPVYGIHVAQALGGGSRQHILYEHDGRLDLFYTAVGGTDFVRTLATGRTVPPPNTPGPMYTDTPYGTVITSGSDRPVIVRPWPLGTASESSSTISQCIRNFGFDSPPRPPTPRRNVPLTSVNDSSTSTSSGSTSLWCTSTPSAIPEGGLWGLGYAKNTDTSPDKAAKFGWAVSYISDTGSEGPRSEIASTTWELPASINGFRYAIALDIPLGPAGTVARKIYRTANYAPDAPAEGDTTLYFVGLVRNNVDTIYYDALQSSDLALPAPTVATGPLPAPRARFSSIWQQSLWLDGGIDDPYSLYYSAPGLIEQYGADAAITLSSAGGAITGIYQHYSTLLIFRESSIDQIQGDYASGYRVSTISTSISCRAPHSIRTVPGLGVVFLALDGIYAITGGFEGGAISDIIRLSDEVDREITSISMDMHAKAVAVYSPQWREYQLYAPTNGNDRPDLGLVLHTERIAGDGSAWSTRVGFPVGCLTTLHDGTVLFGHHTGVQGGNSNNAQGIFVLSARRALGGTIANDTYTEGSPPTSIYRSGWCDFGDPRVLKKPLYVTLWVMSTGTTPTITLRWYKDYDALNYISERTYQSQPPDKTRLPVYDTLVLDATASKWSEERLIPLRFSVAAMSCAYFCFEIETTSDMILMGYDYEYTVSEEKPVPGKRA